MGGRRIVDRRIRRTFRLRDPMVHRGNRPEARNVCILYVHAGYFGVMCVFSVCVVRKMAFFGSVCRRYRVDGFEVWKYRVFKNFIDVFDLWSNFCLDYMCE